MKQELDYSRELGYQLLEWRSKRSPNSKAYVDELGAKSFSQLRFDALRLARHMENVGVKKADLVAFRGTAYFQIVAYFASNYLGAVSAQFVNPSPTKQETALFTHLFLELGSSTSDSRVWNSVDLGALPSRDPSELPQRLLEGDGLRIVFSSGTSGSPKPMLVTCGVMATRMQDHRESLSRKDRLHSFFGAATMLGSYQLVYSVITGEPWIQPKSAKWLAQTIISSKINALQASPLAVEGFMKDLRLLGLTPPRLKRIYLTGGWISEELESRVSEFFGAQILVDYGASEVGKVARRHGARSTPWDSGKLSKSVSLEIIGDDSELLQPGERGRVRISSPAMVDGYLIDETASSFESGYFYPGDFGAVSVDGTLEIFGREGQIANLSGVKIDLKQIEDFAANVLELDSPIAFSFGSASGVMELGLAYKGDSELDTDSIVSSLRMKFGREAPKSFVELSRVPLTPSGKPDRQALAAHLENSND